VQTRYYRLKREFDSFAAVVERLPFYRSPAINFYFIELIWLFEIKSSPVKIKNLPLGEETPRQEEKKDKRQLSYP